MLFWWSSNCVISFNAAADKETTFAITDIKIYIPVVNLSNQNNNAKLLNSWNQDQMHYFLEEISIRSINTGTKPLFTSLNWSTFSKCE